MTILDSLWQDIATAEEAIRTREFVLLSVPGRDKAILGWWRTDETVGRERVTGWFSSFGQPVEPTHWQPLPQSYRDPSLLDLDEALRLPSIFVENDKPWLPRPNSVEFVRSGKLAPISHTASSFVVPFTDDGRIVLSNVRSRGFEIPGGHVEPGETLEQAAIREAYEETGCRISHLVPVGFQRMTSGGEAPPNYRYTHPHGFQQFFAGRVAAIETPTHVEECGEPLILDPQEAGLAQRVTPGVFRICAAAARVIGQA